MGMQERDLFLRNWLADYGGWKIQNLRGRQVGQPRKELMLQLKNEGSVEANSFFITTNSFYVHCFSNFRKKTYFLAFHCLLSLNSTSNYIYSLYNCYTFVLRIHRRKNMVSDPQGATV